jgi:hypothetical protein
MNNRRRGRLIVDLKADPGVYLRGCPFSPSIWSRHGSVTTADGETGALLFHTERGEWYQVIDAVIFRLHQRKTEAAIRSAKIRS